MLALLVSMLSGLDDAVIFRADNADRLNVWAPAGAEPTFDAGQKGMKVVFSVSEWPSLRMKPERPLDFSGSSALAVTVHNPNREPVSMGIRCDDDPSADGFNHTRTGMVTLPPEQTSVVGLVVGVDPKSFGMNGIPKPAGLRSLVSGGAPGWNSKNVVALQLFMHSPAQPTALIVKELRLVPAPSMDGIVDAFGQFAKGNWPGKLTSEKDLAARMAKEDADLKARPALPDRNKFGGWTKGPKLRATGYFRTEKVDGVWWLVDPEGRLFFSNGVDCVTTYSETFLPGRESMFAWLPKEGDPLAEFYGYGSTTHGGNKKEGRTYNFLTANLRRKFGADWKDDWKATAFKRLPSWGFNTIANWSESVLYNNGKVPYVFTAHVNGSHKRLASGNDYWGLMHDPFDPEFRTSVRNSLASAAAIKTDPWCIGAFVDNELSWAGQGPENGRYGLAVGALSNGPDSPAKAALIAELKQKHGGIEKVNSLWKTQFASWEAMQAPYRETLAYTDGQKEDLAAFVALLSDTYHRVVREEFKKLAPNHLYLGCRFAWYGKDAVRAAARQTDVVSFNIYQPALNAKEWEWVKELDRPVVIGEFHFGGLDRGMFHTGLVDAGSQQGRAAMYKSYVASVAAHPSFVGCHWFQYYDQPLTGRVLDGENYQIGLLDVTDTPYSETIQAAREIHGQVYELHRKANR